MSINDTMKSIPTTSTNQTGLTVQLSRLNDIFENVRVRADRLRMLSAKAVAGSAQ